MGGFIRFPPVFLFFRFQRLFAFVFEVTALLVVEASVIASVCPDTIGAAESITALVAVECAAHPYARFSH